MYYVSIPDIDVEHRDVRIQIVGHGDVHDRRQQTDRHRDSYSAWSLAPFTIVLLITEHDGLGGSTETIEVYHGQPLAATVAAS